jgi:hypothetical protein
MSWKNATAMTAKQSKTNTDARKGKPRKFIIALVPKETKIPGIKKAW